MAKSLSQKIYKNQVARFILSAGSGALVDVLVFRVMHFYVLTSRSYRLLSFSFSNYTLSLTTSFFCGVVVNFLITRYLVFSESKSKSSKQFIRFMSVAIVGYFASLMLIKIFIQNLDMKPDIARVCTLGSLFFASFFVHKFFSFSLPSKHRHATTADHQSGN
ncbi:MAG: GtrA family protein [Bacteroidota bacterium]